MGVATAGGRWYHSSLQGTEAPVAAWAAWRRSEMARICSCPTSQGLRGACRGHTAIPGKRCPNPAKATACSFWAITSLRVAPTLKMMS